MTPDRSTDPTISPEKTSGGEESSRADFARVLSQLARIQERLLRRLQEVKDELEASTTAGTLRRFRQRGGEIADETFGQIAEAVEDAIRALNVLESEVHQDLFDAPSPDEDSDLPDLPPRLARFLGERAGRPGFSYEVGQDPVRGWTIRWKEYTDDGTIRGYGHLFERPHAWIED